MGTSTRNVKLGVCNAYYGGKDLGLTQGGVEVSVSTETYRVEVDQHGKTAINDLIQGRTVSVKVPMAESTLRNLVSIMPGATLVTDGAGSKASVTYTAIPEVGDTVVVNGVTFTFAASTAGDFKNVLLGTDLRSTLANLVAALELIEIRPDLGGVAAKISTTGTTLLLEVRDPTPLGDALTLAVTGTAGTASGATFTGGKAETRARVEVTSGAGLDLLSMAQTLRLHPVSRDADDFTDDFILYAAGTGGALQFAYKLDAERIYNVDFAGYPHPEHKKVFAMGDPTAVNA